MEFYSNKPIADKYDFAFAYRIYPGISKRPPIFPNDKFKLTELCLRSFARAVSGFEAQAFFILDSCPPEYKRLCAEYFPDAEFIELEKAGNPATFRAQVDTLLNRCVSELLYFAEDDYFYTPDSIARAVNLFARRPQTDFATLYDHPDYYSHELHKGEKVEISIDGVKWFKAATTCMTFFARRKSLQETREMFLTYARGNYDNSMWLNITGHEISSPIKAVRYFFKRSMAKIVIKSLFYGFPRRTHFKPKELLALTPSGANHLDGDHDAPGVDWTREYEKLL